MAESRAEYRSNHYYCYAEMVELLKAWEAAYPDLLKLESIGKSYEGRDIYAVTLTDSTAGCPDEKPAYYIDANHHAGEVTGSAVALYTIDYLLTNFNRCQRITRLLRETTFYIIPRIAVDGAELYLTSPYMLRSSVREYPEAEIKGLRMEDIDGDGRILQMRIKNPNGKYKISEKDPRLMIPRGPDDWHGDFYDVYVEGIIEDYDGFEIKPARSKWGLDFNRNYPTNWQPEIKQRGAGPYPFSEPETRAVGEFILAHPNITGAMSYHTSGGVILRSRCTGPDSSIDRQDLAIFKALGERGEEITGYPCWSIFEKFTYDKKRPSVGSFIDFAYEQQGIISFATELWDMRGRAGLKKLGIDQMMRLTAREREEQGLKLLEWNDKEFDGRLFVDWYQVEHPQLGTVELGGWEPKFGRQNPPPELLPEECHKNMLFTLAHAEALPKLKLENCQVETLGAGLYSITVDIVNAGYSPTSGSIQAQKAQAVKPLRARLEGSVHPVVGKADQEFGHLSGFAKKRVKWLVSALSGARVDVVVEGGRAGVLRHSIVLK